jgi:hypothetical protein
MCQQLEQLNLVESLPDEVEQVEIVINRALDVRSASMLYLAMNISYDMTPLGGIGTGISGLRLMLLGRVAKVFFTGDERITDSTVYLQMSVDEYSKAVSFIGVRIGIKVYELVKGM